MLPQSIQDVIVLTASLGYIKNNFQKNQTQTWRHDEISHDVVNVRCDLRIVSTFVFLGVSMSKQSRKLTALKVKQDQLKSTLARLLYERDVVAFRLHLIDDAIEKLKVVMPKEEI